MTLTEAVEALGIAVDAVLIAELGQMSAQQRADVVDKFRRECRVHGRDLPPTYLSYMIDYRAGGGGLMPDMIRTMAAGGTTEGVEAMTRTMTATQAATSAKAADLRQAEWEVIAELARTLDSLFVALYKQKGLPVTAIEVQVGDRSMLEVSRILHTLTRRGFVSRFWSWPPRYTLTERGHAFTDGLNQFRNQITGTP